MAIIFVPGSPPTYVFRNEDLTSGSYLYDGITDVCYIGAVAINLDNQGYYRVTARDTVLPQSMSVKVAPATVDSNWTGWITVSGSGTPQQGPNITNFSGFIIKGHPDNGVDVIMYPAGGASGSGYHISTDDTQIPVSASALSSLFFAVKSGSGVVEWLKA